MLAKILNNEASPNREVFLAEKGFLDRITGVTGYTGGFS